MDGLHFAHVASASPPPARSIGVVGTGPSARALACHLSDKGNHVHLLTRDAARLAWLEARGGSIKATGRISGEHPVASFTADPAAMLARADVIFLATVVPAYEDVLVRLAPHLTERHRIVLFSSKLLGSVHVMRMLEELRAPAVPVVETDALFASRLLEDESVWVRGIKAWTLYSGANRGATADFVPLMNELFPGLEPATNVIHRGLTDFGALAHAPTVIANMNAISRGQPFLFYYEGFTDETIALLEACESELRAVAAAFGSELLPMAELLDRYYGCDPRDLRTAMRTVPNYQYSQSPPKLDHRFLREDVGSSLVPLTELGRVAGVPTPTVDAVVHLASVLLREDLRAGGRTLERVGWRGLAKEEILRRIHA